MQRLLPSSVFRRIDASPVVVLVTLPNFVSDFILQDGLIEFGNGSRLSRSTKL